VGTRINFSGSPTNQALTFADSELVTEQASTLDEWDLSLRHLVAEVVYMPVTSRRHHRAALYIPISLAALIGLCIFFWQTKRGHNHIVLEEETQNLTASSWRTVPLNVPYAGNLDVSVRVIRGNKLDVTLIDASQNAKFQDCMSRRIVCRFDFAAVKTNTYHQNSWAERGYYYLVFRDTGLGSPSSPATEVAVRVTLNPDLRLG
jgi:hypothetical protein